MLQALVAPNTPVTVWQPLRAPRGPPMLSIAVSHGLTAGLQGEGACSAPMDAALSPAPAVILCKRGKQSAASSPSSGESLWLSPQQSDPHPHALTDALKPPSSWAKYLASPCNSGDATAFDGTAGGSDTAVHGADLLHPGSASRGLFQSTFNDSGPLTLAELPLLMSEDSNASDLTASGPPMLQWLAE